MRSVAPALITSLLMVTSAFAAPVVHTTDIIPTLSRTALVDFEPLGGASNLPISFSQSGVNVNQINGDANDMWSGCFFSCWYTNNTPNWYPSGGDLGYTEITRSGGADFDAVGTDVSHGFAQQNFVVQYELLDNGVSVLLGSFTFPSGSDGYLGFTGGGFDTVRLRARPEGFVGGFGNGDFQAMAIDNIELANLSQSVPEPGSLALASLALLAAAGGGLARRRAPR